MSASATRNRMVHRTTIERHQTGADDDWGQPVGESWNVLYEDVPCYLWNVSVRRQEEIVTAYRTVVAQEWHMVLPVRYEVHEGDRIVNVTDRLGNMYEEAVFNIRGVHRRKDHRELIVEKHSG